VKKIILIAISLMPCMVTAQKLLKPSIDKITDDTTWATSKEKIYAHLNYLTSQGNGIYCWVKKVSSIKEKILALNPQRVNEGVVFSIEQGQNAYLKLSDKSIITLTAIVGDTGATNVDVIAHTVIATGSAIGYYLLSDEDVEKIKSSPVTFIRVETSTGDFDGDVKPKNGNLIKKEIELVEKK
jgi:hypothetical protein